MKKYDVYFKRYVQSFVKETVRLYTSMKEFGLAKGVQESSEHINKKIEHVSCSRLKRWKAKRKRLYIVYSCRQFCTLLYMLWFFTCFVNFFYIHGFSHLQTIGLRCPINNESNPSS
jgi:hypothetical protein